MDKTHEIQDFKVRNLPVINNKFIPGRWLFFDSETYTKKEEFTTNQYFSMGWSCFWDRWSRYWPDFYTWIFWKNEENFCKYIQRLASTTKQLYLVGHNIFFDLQACGFFDYFTRWGWQLDFIYDKGMTYILRCKKHKWTLTVLSTTNWFDQSLAELGKMVGLEKMDIHFKKATQKQLKVYCRRDVEILVKAMDYYIKFIRKHNLGKLAMTKSSQAFNAYSHRFMYHKITIHKELVITEMERNAYIGGRCECFRIGEMTGGPFVSLDVNSMYPYVMGKYKYPWQLVEFNKHMQVSDYIDILTTYNVISEIEVDTPEPVFAFHYHKKTIFPIGKFNCFVGTEGFRYAMEHGYIKKIINVAVYRTADLFSAYVNYFNKIRLNYQKDNNAIMVKLCKYMQNSLYGKFGQKGIVRDIYDEFTGRLYWKEDIINIDTGEYTTMLKLMNKLIVQYQSDEGENAFPGLAAHITENARFLLWDIIKSTGREKVLYCDTDSIKIRKSDLKYVTYPMNETNPGALKIEEESDRLLIEGAKNYRTEKHRHIKGIPKKAIEIDHNVFQFLSFARQDTHLRQGQIKGAIVTEKKRRLTSKYDKGKVLPDGKVIPFVL